MDPAAPKGVKRVPLSSLRAAAPAIAHPSKRHGVVDLDFEQFNYAFTNTWEPADARAAFERYAVPETGRIFFQDGLANFTMHGPTEVDFDREDRGPLLITVGEHDHTVPPAVAKSNFKKYAHSTATTEFVEFPGRSHLLMSGAGLGGGRRVRRRLAGSRAAAGHRAGGLTVDLGLTDKVAVVTGASKGIGLAITRALADEGAHVVAGARSTDSLDGLERVSAVPVDLAAPDGPALLVRRALDEHGRVDVLVNNVGAVRLRMDGFLGTSDDEFEWALQINFFTALRAIRATIPAMVEQGGGAIVNVASVNAFFQPDAGTIDYGAAKAALLNLSKSLAQEFGAEGHPRQLRLARPGRHRAVARRPRRRRHGRGGLRRRLRHRTRERRRRASAASRPVASPRPRRWPRSSCCWPRSAPPTSREPTT